MGTEVQSTTQNAKEFPPMIGIRKIGQFVKGKVLAVAETKKGNPVLTLDLIDMDGTSSISLERGKYQEVDVKAGDKVQVVGNLTDLRDKLPRVPVGAVVTITYKEDVPSGKGNPKKIFKVVVD